MQKKNAKKLEREHVRQIARQRNGQVELHTQRERERQSRRETKQKKQIKRHEHKFVESTLSDSKEFFKEASFVCCLSGRYEDIHVNRSKFTGDKKFSI